jgi:RimJ/RimL family protein N-acetyltransferase
VSLIPYNQSIKPKLKTLYEAVAAQRVGIARLPNEITDQYIDYIVDSTLQHGIGFCALADENNIIGDIHAEYSNLHIFRNVLRNLTVAVHPQFQGQGIGKTLFQALITEAKKNPHLERIELFCKERNTHGIKLYESFGFKVEGVLRNRTNLDGVPENDLVMGLIFP